MQIHTIASRLISTWRSMALLFSALLLTACTSLAQQPVYQNEAGALEGHDPVAYFTEGRPVKGDPNFSLQRDGTTWYFSSAKNLAMFQSDPEKYSPQYGGYCAQAMAHGLVVSSDPRAFTIRNDKLYMNYSLGVRESWLKDVDNNIQNADREWAKKVADL